jgi:hypothetical protein
MNYACPHCGTFKGTPLTTLAALDHHLRIVHGEGWRDSAPVEFQREQARLMQARLVGSDAHHVVDAGEGSCDDCHRHGHRQTIGLVSVCASCARARLHARELAA